MLFRSLCLAHAGKIAVSDKTRRASAATIDAITAVLEAGEGQQILDQVTQELARIRGHAAPAAGAGTK